MLQLKYILAQVGFWTCCCSVFGFATVYLQGCGLSVSMIGMVVAVGSIMGTVLQPMFAALADRRMITLHRLLMILGIWLAGCMLAINLFSRFYIFVLLLFFMIEGVTWILVPLLNSISVYYKNQGRDLDFGIARGCGSAAYAGSAAILGTLVEGFGVPVIMFCGAAGIGLMLLSIWIMPVYYPADNAAKQSDADILGRGEKGADHFFIFMWKYKRFVMVLIGIMLVFLAHNMNVSYSIQIVRRLGGGSSELGLVLSVSALVEIPGMFLFSTMNKKISARILLITSGFFFFAKMIGMMLCTTMFQFYLVQILQCGSNSLIIPAYVVYTDLEMQPEDRFKGQAYVMAACSLGQVIGSALGGFVIDSFGIELLLILETILAGAGSAIILGFVPEKRETRRIRGKFFV